MHRQHKIIVDQGISSYIAYFNQLTMLVFILHRRHVTSVVALSKSRKWSSLTATILRATVGLTIALHSTYFNAVDAASLRHEQ